MGEKYGVIPGVGFKRKTFKEMEADCIARARALWGAEWQPHETAGEWMIIKNILYEINQAHEAQQELFSYLDDENCTGYFQDVRYKLIGLHRKSQTHSFVECVLTGTYSTIPIGFTVKDSVKGVKYVSTEEIIIDEFTREGKGQFQSLETGSHTFVDPDTLTIAETVNSNVKSITNPLASVGGLDNETDDKFRARKERYLKESDTSSAPAVRNAVLDLDIVSKAEAYENYTDVYSTEFELEPGEIRTIVQGPRDYRIAQAIFDTVAAGIGTTGSVTYDVSGDNAQVKTIKYDIAKFKICYVKVEASEIDIKVGLTEALIEQIKSIVLDYFNNLDIHQSVSATKLQSKITNTIKIIYDCQVYIDLSPSFAQWLRYIHCAFDEIAYTDISKIQVVEI